MIKKIIFSDEATKEMNFEEVRKRFKPTLIQTMRRANNKSVYNALEEEDFMQELEIELWRAFEQYDPSTGYCFSTYLHYRLLKGVRDATYYRYSLKNKHNGLISMNQPVGADDLKLEDLFPSEDTSMNNILYQELVKLIKDNILEDEEETLFCMMNKKDYSVQDYADKNKITRQAANQRIVRLRKKLSVIVEKQYLGKN